MPRRTYLRDDRYLSSGDWRNDLGHRPSEANYTQPQRIVRTDSTQTGIGYGYDDHRPEDDPTAYSGYTRPADDIDPDIRHQRGERPEYWGGHWGAQDRFESDITDRYGYGRGTFQDRDIYGRGEEYYGGYAPHPRTPQRPDYRGRGPKGYSRTDERILEDVCEHLMDDPTLDASNIEVTCQDGVVTLSGSVDSRTKKYIAESLTADIRGVKDIVNDLSVTQGWPGGRTPQMPE